MTDNTSPKPYDKCEAGMCFTTSVDLSIVFNILEFILPLPQSKRYS